MVAKVLSVPRLWNLLSEIARTILSSLLLGLILGAALINNYIVEWRIRQKRRQFNSNATMSNTTTNNNKKVTPLFFLFLLSLSSFSFFFSFFFSFLIFFLFFSFLCSFLSSLFRTNRFFFISGLANRKSPSWCALLHPPWVPSLWRTSCHHRRRLHPCASPYCPTNINNNNNNFYHAHTCRESCDD